MLVDYLKSISHFMRNGYPTAAEQSLRKFIESADPSTLRDNEAAIRCGIAEFFVPRQRAALTELLGASLPPPPPAMEMDPFDAPQSQGYPPDSQIDFSRFDGSCKFADIPKEFGGQTIPYGILLNTVEWYERRTPILDRDSHKCQGTGCQGVSTVLQVHHRFYIIGKNGIEFRLPWDYPDTALVTLCKDCHTALHRDHKVSVYEEVGSKLVKKDLRSCSRCLGSGWFPQWLHIMNGICFRCKGARFEEEIIAAFVPALS